MSTILKVIKERLRMLSIRPSKGLGQNFLIESRVYEKIAKAAEIEKGEVVLEIGPGVGTLTEYLITAGAKVIAIEKDRKLIKFLENLFISQGSYQGSTLIIEGDVLTLRPQDYGLVENGYKVVANIPYYITSRLLRTIFETWPKPKLIVLLVQREVAQRIVAKPPHLNLLAISVQYFAQPKIMGKVPKGNFYPMPKVDSTILRLEVRSKNQEVSEEEEKQFFRVIKTGFSSKRKKLVNNLSVGFKLDPAQNYSADHQQKGRILSGTSKKELENLLISLKIEPTARPENLTIEQWQELAKML